MILNSLDDLSIIITNNKLNLIYIKSDKCSVCKSVLPKIEDLILTFKDLNLNIISIDAVPELSSILEVFQAPTLVIYYQNKEIYRMSRFFLMDKLEKDINKLLSLIRRN